MPITEERKVDKDFAPELLPQSELIQLFRIAKRQRNNELLERLEAEFYERVREKYHPRVGKGEKTAKVC